MYSLKYTSHPPKIDINMVRTCPGKSWNVKIFNSRPGKSWKNTKKNQLVLEFHLTSHLNLFWLTRQQDLRPELQVSNGIILFSSLTHIISCP